MSVLNVLQAHRTYSSRNSNGRRTTTIATTSRAILAQKLLFIAIGAARSSADVVWNVCRRYSVSSRLIRNQRLDRRSCTCRLVLVVIEANVGRREGSPVEYTVILNSMFDQLEDLRHNC